MELDGLVESAESADELTEGQEWGQVGGQPATLLVAVPTEAASAVRFG